MKKLFFYTLLISSYAFAMNRSELNKQLFTRVYNDNLWGSFESRSGDGSTIYRTGEVRRVLPELITRLNIKTILDAGCGDFNWMRSINFDQLDQYMGFDIVDDLIYDNIIKYQDTKQSFRCADITYDTLPQVDLIIERDCMMHADDTDVKRFINLAKKSGSKYLLATTFPSTQQNIDLSEPELYQASRISRRNLQIAPFNFPDPLGMFDEGYESKAIALWSIDTLPFFYDV